MNVMWNRNDLKPKLLAIALNAYYKDEFKSE